MATTLFFRAGGGDGNHYAGVHRGTNSAKYDLSLGIWQPMQLSTTRGTTATPGIGATVPSVAGPTGGVEFTEPSLGYAMEFISAPLAAGVTISGLITYNLWGNESSMSANLALNIGVDRLGPDGAVISQVAKSNNTTEAGTASAVANFTVAATSTTFAKGDRIRVRVLIDDSGGTMGGGFNGTFEFAGATGAARGDSFVTFTENLTFATADPAGTKLFLTDTAGPAVGAELEKEMWTARGGSTNTAVVATQAGFAAPKRWTDTSGGTNIEWYTRPLNAFTLAGLIKLRTRAVTSNIASWTSLRAEIAVVNGDGSGAVIWSAQSFIALGGVEGAWNPLGATDSGGRLVASPGDDHVGYLAGPDIAVTNGQRLRLRFYADDSSGDASVAGHTCTISYDDSTVDGTGDSWLQLDQTVTEFVSSTPRYIDRGKTVRRLASHIGSVIARFRTVPRVPLVPRFVARERIVPAAHAGPVGAVTALPRTIPRTPLVDRVVNRAIVVPATPQNAPDPVLCAPLSPARRFVAPVAERFVQRTLSVPAVKPAAPAQVTTRTVRLGNALLRVAAWQFFNDDANPDVSTPRFPENTPITITDTDVGNFNIRFQIENPSGFNSLDTLVLEGRINGGAWGNVGTVAALSPHFVNAWAVSGPRLTTSALVFSFDSVVRENLTAWVNRLIVIGEYHELGLIRTPAAALVAGDVVELRVARQLLGGNSADEITQPTFATINVLAVARPTPWPVGRIVGSGQIPRPGTITTVTPTPAQRTVVVVADRRIDRSRVVEAVRPAAPRGVIAPWRARPQYFDRVARAVVVDTVRPHAPASVAAAWRTIARPQYFDAVLRRVVVGAVRRARGAITTATVTPARRDAVVVVDRVVNRAVVVAAARRHVPGRVTSASVHRLEYFDAVRRTRVVATEARTQRSAATALGLTPTRRFVAVTPTDRALNRALLVDTVRPHAPALVAMSWRTVPRIPLVDVVRRAVTVAALRHTKPVAAIARWRVVPRPPERRVPRPWISVSAARQVSVRSTGVDPGPARRTVVAPAERFKQRYLLAAAIGDRHALAVTTRWRTVPRQPLLERYRTRAAVTATKRKLRPTGITRTLTPPRRLVVVVGVRRIPHVAIVGVGVIARLAVMRMAWRRANRVNPPGPSHGSASVTTQGSRVRVIAPHSATTEAGSGARQQTASGTGRTAMITSRGHTEAEQT